MDCLEHRVAEVRAGAERCLAAIIACGGLDAVNRCLRDLKPAQLKSLRPIVEKAEKAAAALSGAHNGAAGNAEKAEAISSGDNISSATAKAVARETLLPAVEREPSLQSVVRKESTSASTSTGATKKVPPLTARAAVQPEPSEHADDSESGPADIKALRCNGGKDAREKQHGKVKWVLDDAREAEMLLDTLDRQMASVSSEEIHAKLFSKDFKKQVEGIRDLVSFIAQYPKVINLKSSSPLCLLIFFSQELTDNLDLVLKMCALRMTGKAANTTLVLAVLELLRAVFEVRELLSLQFWPLAQRKTLYLC
jgi:hypothetical protein